MAESDLPSPLSSLPLREQLTSQFYDWEERGRGWRLWPYPVELEPPFRPCRMRLQPPPAEYDDAKRQTLFSSLSGLLSIRSRAPVVQTKDWSPDEKEASPSDESDAPNIELQIALPETHKVSPHQAEQLLLSLSYCACPLSFEVIGSSDAVCVQVVGNAQDYSRLSGQMRAYFPEAVVTKRTGYLEGLWENAGSMPLLVDFGLSREFLLPLEVASSFEVDPLISAVGALSGLKTGEVGVFQVLFQPARHPWAEAALDSITAPDGSAFFPGWPELLPQAKRKFSRPLFAAVVRIAARADTSGRVWDIARALGGTLSVFASPSGNELIPLSNDDYDDGCHEYALIRRASFRSGMLMSSEELISLVHFPSASVRAEKLVRDAGRTRLAPAIILGHSQVLGENIHNSETRAVTLSQEQRSRHIHLIGSSGTGKSTLLLNLITQDIARGEGVGVLDPHGDLIDRIIERVPESRQDDVILFDPGDEDYPVGFNILSASSDQERHLLSSDLVATFRRLSTSWGDQMTSVLGNAVLAFLESTEGGTLSDLRRFLVEPGFRKAFLQTVTDPEVVYYWQKEFPLLSGRPQAPLLTRLDSFLRPKLIRHVVSQKENRLDVRAIMDGRKILLAKLAQGTVGEENGYLLGTLLVSKLHQAALSRQSQAESDRRPFYLYIDEFHNFITPSMASILSGARKYRLALTLAHQEFRQLWNQDTDVASAVIANPYTRICFRLGDFDAEKLADGFAHFGAEDLQNLGVGEAIARVERAEYDFNLKTPPAASVNATTAQGRRERIVEQSRARYASRREDVEALILRGIEAATSTELQPDPPRSRRAEPKREASAAIEREGIPRPSPDERPTEEPTTHAAPPDELPRRTSRRDAITSKPLPEGLPEAEPTLGRGGQQHRYLQHLVKRLAADKEYRVTIEQSVLGGTGSVDVALEKGGQRIAVEISVTSTDEYELKNIQKCLAAGFDSVVLLSQEPRFLGKVRRRAESELNSENLSRVLFLTPEQFVTFLDEREAASLSGEETVRGYKVKVSYKAVEETEKNSRKQAISEVLLRAMKRMKKPKG
jgi:hypothetical protein